MPLSFACQRHKSIAPYVTFPSPRRENATRSLGSRRAWRNGHGRAEFPRRHSLLVSNAGSRWGRRSTIPAQGDRSLPRGALAQTIEISTRTLHKTHDEVGSVGSPRDVRRGGGSTR